MRKVSRFNSSKPLNGVGGLALKSRLSFLIASIPHVREIALVAGAYFAYMYTRNLIFPDVEFKALDNALRTVGFLKRANVFWEPVIQDWVLDNAKHLVYVLNWMYIITFWPIVLGTAVLFYVRDRTAYRHYRNMVLLSFVVAMLIFMTFPLAPPRMLVWEGLVDTVKNFGPDFYNSREAQSYFNAFAAMPSIHFAWTVLFGYLFFRTGVWWLRLLGPLYPIATFFAIVGTANHYIIDAAGGGFVALTVYALYRYTLYRQPLPPPHLGRRRSPQGPVASQE
ncbi:MAG: phosphatase PAP2 family protein [Chloroflexi bacterium]|nr:phosphatase PAP2 family protein [Chloroflexota bacterium]